MNHTPTSWIAKREPLLSDDGITKMVPEEADFYDCELTGHRVREVYEAARAKDAELIRQLVDALQNAHDRHNGVGGTMYISEEHKALSAAKAAGFKPSDR